jgi:hypothetical protein
MQSQDLIQFQFDFMRKSLRTVLDGLTAEEMSWRPGEANSIAFILFHITRSEDLNIQTRMQGRQQVWVTSKWYDKFGLAADETSFGWTEERLAAFKFPEPKTMLAYSDAVRKETEAFFTDLTPESLERIINVSYLGDIPAGRQLARMVVHISGHIGEISYIRGLKRGLNK